MITYSVVGASGYVGGELLRIAAGHPELRLHQAAAFTNSGERIQTIHPHLFHLSERHFDSIDVEELRRSDVVFLALPHGKSAELAKDLHPDQLVIDAGADFRLKSQSDWEGYYGGQYAGSWPYGLPELILAGGAKQRDRLSGVKRIAAPGCNVSAITLALAPGLAADAFTGAVNAVLAVGTSGAGRTLKANLLASEVAGNASAYGVAGEHRHNPEIIQNFSAAGGQFSKLNFTPILVPMSRGILAVCHVELSESTTEQTLRDAYRDAYQDEHFVQVLPPGEQPRTGALAGSNFTHIGIEVNPRNRVATITLALDNLVKGTAGAAIQSMNIALGFPEATGLDGLGVAP